mmetsp:Transcript_16165/g.43529  ORF Transcript_16165/g.43529 Transcript_16165/m.43529 type:complete len:358 (+) Transcript_16165:48-1121(+)
MIFLVAQLVGFLTSHFGWLRARLTFVRAARVRMPSVRARPHSMAIIGHRGASALHPENTVASLRAALDAGAHGVEFDLQQLADGTLVLLHDETLARTACDTEEGAPTIDAVKLGTNVSELNYADISTVDVGGECLPLFSDALSELVGQYPTALSFAELKAGASLALVREGERVVSAVGARPNQLVFISFDLAVCEEAKKLAPAHDVLLVAKCLTEREAHDVVQRAADRALSGVDLNADPRVVTTSVVAAAHRRGLLVAVWVGKAPAANDVPVVWEYMSKVGVDFLTTNMPRALTPWRRASQGSHMGADSYESSGEIRRGSSGGGTERTRVANASTSEKESVMTFLEFWRSRHKPLSQ